LLQVDLPVTCQTLSTWVDRDKPIGIASDHAGFDLKEKIREHLQELGFQVRDFGTYEETDGLSRLRFRVCACGGQG